MSFLLVVIGDCLFLSNLILCGGILHKSIKETSRAWKLLVSFFCIFLGQLILENKTVIWIILIFLFWNKSVEKIEWKDNVIRVVFSGISNFSLYQVTYFTIETINQVLGISVLPLYLKLITGILVHVQFIGFLHMTKDVESVYYSKRIVVPFFLFSLMLVVNAFVAHGMYQYAKNMDGEFCYVNVFCILIELGLFAEQYGYIGQVFRGEKAKRNELLAKQYVEMQTNYYKYMDYKNAEARKMRHDIKGHLNYIGLLTEAGRYGEIETYLTSIGNRVDELTNNFDVRNDEIGILVNYYADLAAEKNIPFCVEGTFPDDFYIEAYEACTIFSNLYMNALNASFNTIHIPIKTEISSDNQYVHVVISNGFAKGTYGDLLYRKEQDHGWGNINVDDAVNKSKGYIVREKKDNTYIVKIMWKRGGLDESSGS